MTLIALEGIDKRFGATPALSDVSLDFPSGSFTALLGPSGCGKTTLLRLIAGFEAPTTREIRFAGKPSRTPSGKCRRKRAKSAWCFSRTRSLAAHGRETGPQRDEDDRRLLEAIEQDRAAPAEQRICRPAA